MPQKLKQRLTYIDWLRGLACVLMFQTHCYDSWLGGSARQTKFLEASRLGGTLPAPLFLFLAGLSFALVTSKLRERGSTPGAIARTTIRRGAEVFGLGMLFRVQEFLLGQPGAPWTDLLRVDVLNVIGLSMVVMGLVCRFAGAERGSWVAALVVAAAVVTSTPPLWTTWRPRWLPWYLESYINGVHIFREPQPWLFPLFPWMAFALVGLAVGFFLFSDWSGRNQAKAVALLGLWGAGIAALGWWLDSRPGQLYAVYDFWHTSPNFFLIRIGILFLVLFGAYAWCRWGAAERRFSPMIQLGQTSLLVYCVHIEFVYGRFSILTKRAASIPRATLGLLVIFVAMLVLSIARTKLKGRGAHLLGWFRRPARA